MNDLGTFAGHLRFKHRLVRIEPASGVEVPALGAIEPAATYLVCPACRLVPERAGWDHTEWIWFLAQQG
jgi:hypothetical protein